MKYQGLTVYKLQKIYFSELNPPQIHNSVFADFYSDLPKNPYCTDEKGVCYPRNKPNAIKHAYIQPNHPASIKWLVFDLDTSNAIFAYHDNNLPRPQFIVRNPSNGHAHYCYKLTTEVGTWGKSSVKAIEYLRAVYNALSKALGADGGYSGNLIKNPFSSQHETYITGAKPSYSLDELAEYLDLSTPIDPTPQNDDYFGRNCTLFHKVRKIAYRIADYYDEQKLYRELLILLEKNNLSFDKGLQYKELKHIAKSITRYCKSPRFAEYKRQSTERFSKKQAKRGANGAKRANEQGANSQGGKARSATYDQQRIKAREMHQQGTKIINIAKELDVHRNTIRSWINEV